MFLRRHLADMLPYMRETALKYLPCLWRLWFSIWIRCSLSSALTHVWGFISTRALMCFWTDWQLVFCSIPCSTVCQLAAAEVTSPPHCWLPPACLLRTSCWQPKQGFSQQPSHMMNHPRLPPELLALLRVSPDAARCLLPRLKPAALLPFSTRSWALRIHDEHDFGLWMISASPSFQNTEDNFRPWTSQRIQKIWVNKFIIIEYKHWLCQVIVSNQNLVLVDLSLDWRKTLKKC